MFLFIRGQYLRCNAVTVVSDIIIIARRCSCLLGDKYVLKMRFVDHVYDDQVIEHMTLKVILPEGAR